MEKIKLYIIKIILVAAVVQIGGLIVGSKSYQKLYKLIGGVFVIIAMISFPTINISEITDDLNYETIETSLVQGDFIKSEFANRVSDKIKADIEDRFEKRCDVYVDIDDDFSKLNIRVSAAFDEESARLIQKYITESYCAESDEVIVVNETK